MDSNCSTSSSEGFWTCTESLGFESSDERGGGEGGDQHVVVGEKRDEAACEGRPPLRRKKRPTDVMFPPPLPGLDWSGRSKTVLRAERGDGRLRLTEFKVGRPDTLHACREGGRLKLHLVAAGAGDSARVDDEEDIEEEGGAVMVGRLVPAVRWWHEESGVAVAAAAAPPRGIPLFGALAA